MGTVMVRAFIAASVCVAGLLAGTVAFAQDTGAARQTVRLATVTRPPFSQVEDGVDTGFSIDLWRALAEHFDVDTEIVRVDTFKDMLDMVRRAEVDAAAANISITAERETEMDFSQPIFESGLSIMVPKGDTSATSIFSAFFSRDLLLAIALAFGLLFGAGMLMWLFERRHQPYFDQPARKAVFPSFWWALNLVVNGGFEERQPHSFAGRVLAVILVVASLFLVSVFVARITATMTVEAIQSSVSSVNDLYGRQVGTTSGSTAAAFLDSRDIRYRGFDGLDTLLDAFEREDLDAVVFDAPVLAYYVHTKGQGVGEIVGSEFLRDNYGIALPTGSPLAEKINQSLLRLREDGTYETIRRRWFGGSG